MNYTNHDTDEPMNIRKSIKIALIKKDKPAKWLAEQLGVTPQYLSKLQKHGHTPNTSTCEKLASIFDMSVSEFIALGEE